MPRLILLSMLMLLPKLTLAQEVGDIVFVTAREYPLIKDVDNKFPVKTLIRGSMLRIDAVEEMWFKTSWDGFSLWISRQHVALPDEAIEYFTQAIEENPTAQDHDIRGWIYNSQRKYDLAMADFNQAILLDPKYAMAFSRRGALNYDLKLYRTAIADFRKAFELDRGFVQAIHNCGLVYDEIGEYEDAIEMYSRAIELNPDFALAYSNRGFTWERQGEIEKAIADYSQAIELEPEHKLALVNRAYAYRLTGRYQESIQDYEAAILAAPASFAPYSALALMYAACPDDEIRDGEKAVNLGLKAC